MSKASLIREAPDTDRKENVKGVSIQFLGHQIKNCIGVLGGQVAIGVGIILVILALPGWEADEIALLAFDHPAAIDGHKPVNLQIEGNGTIVKFVRSGHFKTVLFRCGVFSFHVLNLSFLNIIRSLAA